MTKIRDIKFDSANRTQATTSRQRGVRGVYERSFSSKDLLVNGKLVRDSHAIIQRTHGVDGGLIATVFNASAVPAEGYVSTSSNYVGFGSGDHIVSADASLIGIAIPIFSTIELNHMTMTGAVKNKYMAELRGDAKKTSTLKSFSEMNGVVNFQGFVNDSSKDGVPVEDTITKGDILRIVNFRFGAGNSTSNRTLRERVESLDSGSLQRDKWKFPHHPSTALLERVREVMTRVYNDMESALLNATGLSTLDTIKKNGITITPMFEQVGPAGGIPPLAFNCRILIEGDLNGDVTRIIQMILAAQIDSMDVDQVVEDLEVINRYHKWLAK